MTNYAKESLTFQDAFDLAQEAMSNPKTASVHIKRVGEHFNVTAKSEMTPTEWAALTETDLSDMPKPPILEPEEAGDTFGEE